MSAHTSSGEFANSSGPGCKRADLEWLAERAAEGTIRPVVGATYSLADAPAALRLIESGHARGKVVVAVTSAPGPLVTRNPADESIRQVGAPVAVR